MREQGRQRKQGKKCPMPNPKSKIQNPKSKI
jgi:hypothetical protein